ncbi:MAG: DNA adenine methylase [Methanobrevibacter sp.]|jgi:DNA adenine methylase|nr:DNA adenine methylase [Methanobrevibacter sp.]
MQIDLYNNQKFEVKPFLKWAGGKTQLIKDIESSLPKEIKKTKEIKYYFEPFVGGGAIFFYLVGAYNIKEAFLYDINKELILAYNAVKNDPEDLINLLMKMEKNFLAKNDVDRKEYFLDIRKKFNDDVPSFNFEKYSPDHVKRAAYTIFLNKTCFNGLFRLNKNGEFNVPMGRYKNPKICDSKNIRNVSECLQIAKIFNCSFKTSKDLINNESLVYLDPPYRPLNKTSNFTSYSENEFNDKEQEELAQYFDKITDKGAKAILSNSDPKNEDENDDFFDELYSNYNIVRVKAKRFINSNAKKRGPINEIIVRNY